MSFYLLLLWIHLLAAIGWIGGMLFLSLVLAPLVRSRKAAADFMALFRLAARRFRALESGLPSLRSCWGSLSVV